MSGLESEFVKQAFESNYVAPLGPMVDAFEREFAEKVGIPYAVAVFSGTAAMHLALRVLGVGLGDEVIASTLTFIGGVTPIIFQGANTAKIEANKQYREHEKEKENGPPWKRDYWEVLKEAMGLKEMTALELMTKFCFFCPRPLRKVTKFGLEGVG